MRKILNALIAIVFVVGLGSVVNADNYSGTLSTFTVTSATMNFVASGYPMINGGAKIDKIILSSTETLTLPILISVYDTCTSTTAATEDGYWVYPASPTAFGASLGMISVDYPVNNPRIYTSPAFYMKANGLGKKVYIDIQYR